MHHTDRNGATTDRIDEGDARSAGVEDAGARASAWRRRRGSHRADHARRVSRQARLAVSRAAPSRTGRIHHRHVERDARGAAREVLQNYRGGPQAARPPKRRTGRASCSPSVRCSKRSRTRGDTPCARASSRRLGSFWNTLFRKERLERDLDDELRAAVDTLAERYTADGMDPAAARRAALAAIGGVEQVKEARPRRTHRRLARYAPPRSSLRLPRLLESSRPHRHHRHHARARHRRKHRDLQRGARHAALAASLSRRRPPRLHLVRHDRCRLPARAVVRPRAERPPRCAAARSSGVAAIWSNTTALTGDGHPEQLRIGLVTPDFFSVLGAEPALGRTFRPEDGGDERAARRSF